MKNKISTVIIQQIRNNFDNKPIETYKKTQKHLVTCMFFTICAHIFMDIALIPDMVMLEKNRASLLTIIAVITIMIIIMTVISIYMIVISVYMIANSILINERINEQIAKEKTKQENSSFKLNNQSC